MSLFKNTANNVPMSKPAETPPSVEQVHNVASANSEFALSSFTGIVADLEDANTDFDAVEMRTSAEIAHLTELRDQARAQRRANLATIEAVNGLLGK